MTSSKTNAARRTVEVLAPRSRIAKNSKETARVGMLGFGKVKKLRLESIALNATAKPDVLDNLIHRAWLARLRLRFVGELPKPSEAKQKLSDLTAACRKMNSAARELSGALRGLGNLGQKLDRWPGSSDDVIKTLSQLVVICDGFEAKAKAFSDNMPGRQTETPLDYAVIDAIADAWQDAGLKVTFTARGASYFQKFVAEAIKPHKIDNSIYRAVWEERKKKISRVR